jgi:hypothetical protein
MAGQRQTDLKGEWGGRGIRLTLTADGGSFELDCAHGTLDQALALDDKGGFDVAATLFAEHGGPVRKDEVASSTPVRCRGALDGPSLTLELVPKDGIDPIASYALRRDEHGRLMKCR